MKQQFGQKTVVVARRSSKQTPRQGNQIFRDCSARIRKPENGAQTCHLQIAFVEPGQFPQDDLNVADCPTDEDHACVDFVRDGQREIAADGD